MLLTFLLIEAGVLGPIIAAFLIGLLMPEESPSAADRAYRRVRDRKD